MRESPHERGAPPKLAARLRQIGPVGLRPALALRSQTNLVSASRSGST
jgi:hypothetical protein